MINLSILNSKFQDTVPSIAFYCVKFSELFTNLISRILLKKAFGKKKMYLLKVSYRTEILTWNIFSQMKNI